MATELTDSTLVARSAYYAGIGTIKAHKLCMMPNTMTWTPTHFPAAMRSLNPRTRAKAIEIANQLLEQGVLDKQHLVMFSINEARRWARQSQPEPLSVAAQSFA